MTTGISQSQSIPARMPHMRTMAATAPAIARSGPRTRPIEPASSVPTSASTSTSPTIPSSLSTSTYSEWASWTSKGSGRSFAQRFA